MALDNYSNLVEALESWSHRNDIDLYADDCITLCEQEMYNSDLPLMVKELEGKYTAAVSAQEVSLPVGLIKFRDVRILIDGEYHQMRFVPPADLPEYSTSGTPVYYTVSSSLAFDRTPDQEYTIKARYYAKPTGLSSSNTTNTILTNYPHIYLWGCVSAAFFYAGEEEKALLWGDRFKQAVVGANAATQSVQLGANPTMRVEGWMP